MPHEQIYYTVWTVQLAENFYFFLKIFIVITIPYLESIRYMMYN